MASLIIWHFHQSRTGAGWFNAITKNCWILLSVRLCRTTDVGKHIPSLTAREAEMYVALSFPGTLPLRAVLHLFWSQSPARQNNTFTLENEVSATRCTSIIRIYFCNQKLCEKHWDAVYREICIYVCLLNYTALEMLVQYIVYSILLVYTFSRNETLWNIVPTLPILILKVWSIIIQLPCFMHGRLNYTCSGFKLMNYPCSIGCKDNLSFLRNKVVCTN